VNFGSYRSDNTTIAYARPILLPGPWSSEDGHATLADVTIVGHRNAAYPYSPGFCQQLLLSDGRVLMMSSNSEAEFSSDTGFNGRYMVMNP